MNDPTGLVCGRLFRIRGDSVQMMRWIVDTKTIKPQRHSESSRCSFPAKTKPNRPTPSRDGWVTATRGDAWPCPERRDRYRGRVPLTDEQRAMATRYLPMAS